MFTYAQNFVNYFFAGADQTVIDFFAVLVTVGVMVLTVLPLILIVKYIFKR